jgi:hypothetical protein
MVTGDQDNVSLCWQNLDPLEDSRATDSSVSNANPSHNGKRVEEAYGDRRVRARLLAWFQSMVPGLGAPIPARTGLEPIRTSTK